MLNNAKLRSVKSSKFELYLSLVLTMFLVYWALSKLL